MTIDRDIFCQTITTISAAMGIIPSRAGLDKLARYDEMLRDENTRQNLTRDIDAPDFIERLYMDSLTPLAVMDTLSLKPQGVTDMLAVDIGSGAGMPGIPLAIMRDDITFTLLDSLGKRCLFLRRVVDALDLRAHVIHARAEDFARDRMNRGKYNLAFSRAVAQLPVLMEMAAPLLKIGGCLISHKGPAVGQEYPAAQKAASILGMQLDDPIPASVPGSSNRHVLVAARQLRRCPDIYPRQAGTPARSPLGT